MSPETMANMSGQFGMRLSQEVAEKPREAMSSLSPDDLEITMNWADRVQRVVGAKKTKKLASGKTWHDIGNLLAVILHWMGFIDRWALMC